MPEGLVNPLGLDERTRAYRKSTSSPDPFQDSAHLPHGTLRTNTVKRGS